MDIAKTKKYDENEENNMLNIGSGVLLREFVNVYHKMQERIFFIST